MNGALSHLKEFLDHNGTVDNNPTVHSSVQWCPPPPGCVKLNFDAAVFKEGGIGLGGLVRNSQGVFVGWFMDKTAGGLSPECAEFMAALSRGIQFASTLGLELMIVEGDCLSAIHKLVSEVEDLSEGECIVQACKNIGMVKFAHVNRDGNAWGSASSSSAHSQHQGVPAL